MKNKARFLWALAAVTALTGVYGVRHGHELRAMVRNAYHHYKDSRAQATLSKYELRERADEPLVIYDDKLGRGWMDWSWAKHDLHWSQDVYDGASAIRMEPANWKGLYFSHRAIGLLGYGTLEMYVRGGAQVDILLVDGHGKFGKKLSLQQYCRPARGGWSVADIPVSDFGVAAHGARLSGVVVQARGAAEPEIFLDQISLLPDLSLPPALTQATVTATVDVNAGRHPISPQIYGMAFAKPEYLQDLRLGVNRWGGNDKSRYNWVQGNAVNAARDWQWRNRRATYGKVPIGPSSAADQFVQTNRDGATQTMLTVPMIGWVSADDNSGHRSMHVPKVGGAPLDSADGAIAGYDPADNRRQTSIPSMARKGRPFADPPDAMAGAVYQDEWIAHLKHTFGDAAHGGVQYYAMDNEPDLWDTTHTDIHPARMGYDDVLSRFLEYSNAVKDVDPTAQITGPVSWGWTGYKYSALDRGSDNFHTHADSDAHGGGPFLPWFLKQVCENDRKKGRRSLDILDVHYYPQGDGIYGSGVDKDAQARRLRAVRSLWDPEYTDESWIGDKIALIPRLKQWVAQNYPGTKVGLTEWNFGADATANGGLTIAEALGVFGREGLDMACYWAYPSDQSAGYLAFKIYRNADGLGHGFGDTSVSAASSDSSRVSVYGGLDSATGDVTVMLVNKMPKATVTTPLDLRGLSAGAHRMSSWRLAADPTAAPLRLDATLEERRQYKRRGEPMRLEALPAQSIQGGHVVLTLAPYSVTLLRIPAHS
ncbi:hypothetical protein CCAX7_007840 [Capsulimonas corticalis]|uniref:Glycoside hydrolase family 44 catalytic domain-containing protein n=1 Tax=Capsulimonas corticalis TaxID=2219043 RepID=A0A402D1Y5_9BACT|nr:glycoside hydrolase family 44 protein [Capsulimonas corticalis]BDI28733.1 hypothetical protein CCAX7_007840 [Capsulimonas corticalis]